MLANNMIHWTDDKHKEFADKVYENKLLCHKGNNKIAKEKEPTHFKGSDWETESTLILGI